MDNFVHLHVHSQNSILDGLGKPEGYAKLAADFNQPALAITDHGGLSGAYRGWKACKDVGIKFIAGSEVYFAPDSRHTKEPVHFGKSNQRSQDVGSGGKHCHITILARSSEGIRNLYRLQSEAYLTGFYGKPRVDLELLHDHRSGLIILSGCAGSLLSTFLRLGLTDRALNHAAEMKEIFGDSYYIEVMSHGIENDELNERELNGGLLDVADRLDITPAATNDAHYETADEAGVHDALLCMSTHAQLGDAKRFRFAGSGYHLRSTDEMARVLGETGIPERAADATVEIADRVESYDDIFAHSLRMPKFTGFPDDFDWGDAERMVGEWESERPEAIP